MRVVNRTAVTITGAQPFVDWMRDTDADFNRAITRAEFEQAALERFRLLDTGHGGSLTLAGLDALHWHALPRPTPGVSALGLVLFVLGWCIKSLALRANAFAVAVVRLQTERGHAVADRGPYRIVRHPFYAADPLILVGLGLWLESYVAALAAAVPITLMVVRLLLEEDFLRRELPGYAAYVDRVRFRLIPGIW